MSVKTIDKSKSSNRLKKQLRMIAVDADNYEQLKLMGHVPESFNTVVGRLIAEHNARDNVATAAGDSTKAK
jgi:predicted CopG family antitoxin